MMKRHGIVWVLALGLVLVSGFAFADEAAKNDDLAKLNKAVAEAKVTFAQAIETAQKEVADGQMIEIELEATDATPVFEVEFVVGDAMKQVKICAVEGKVLKVEDEVADADEVEAIAAAKKALPTAKITFVQALEAAAKDAKDAKPVEIKLTLFKDAPTYEVEFVTATETNEYHVDAVSGEVKGSH